MLIMCTEKTCKEAGLTEASGTHPAKARSMNFSAEEPGAQRISHQHLPSYSSSPRPGNPRELVGGWMGGRLQCPDGTSESQACLAARLSFRMERKGALLQTQLLQMSVFIWEVTHLFFPFVTHSSATWRRSETLRDSPSPVVPFTVPNKGSVSGANQYLSLIRCWEGGVRNACSRGRDRKVGGQNQGGEGKMTCFRFLPLPWSKVAGRLILTYYNRPVTVIRDGEQRQG